MVELLSPSDNQNAPFSYTLQYVLLRTA